MHKVLEENEYIILGCNNTKGYIVYNRKKDWKNGHTHIRELKQAKDLIFCAERYILPRRANKYFLVSLSRITDNPDYYDVLQDAINRTSNKKTKYRNNPKMR